MSSLHRYLCAPIYNTSGKFIGLVSHHALYIPHVLLWIDNYSIFWSPRLHHVLALIQGLDHAHPQVDMQDVLAFVLQHVLSNNPAPSTRKAVSTPNNKTRGQQPHVLATNTDPSTTAMSPSLPPIKNSRLTTRQQREVRCLALRLSLALNLTLTFTLS